MSHNTDDNKNDCKEKCELWCTIILFSIFCFPFAPILWIALCCVFLYCANMDEEERAELPAQDELGALRDRIENALHVLPFRGSAAARSMRRARMRLRGF